MPNRSRTFLAPLAAVAAVALGVVALAPAAASAAPSLKIASGSVPNASGGFPWEVRARRVKLGPVAGVCLDVDHSWTADGSSFGNVATGCVAGSVGGRFSLQAGRCNGVAAVIGRASAGANTIRKLAFAVDARARSLRIAFPGGQRTTVRAVRAPRALRLPVRIAWLVDAGTAFPRSATALMGKRKVGSWRAGVRC